MLKGWAHALATKSPQHTYNFTKVWQLHMLCSHLQVSKRGTPVSRPDASQSQPQQQHQQAKQQLPEGPSRQQGSEEVPEIVNDRMLKRIIAFSGIPVFVGFSLFPFFYFLKV